MLEFASPLVQIQEAVTMGKSSTFALRSVRGILLTVAFVAMGPFSDARAQAALDPSAAADEKVPPSLQGPVNPEPHTLAARVPGETLVFFFPTDNDATATVMYLVNTDSVAHIVQLRGYSYNGVLVYSLNINVGAISMVRLASDSIASAPPPSWATPPPIITNFTDFTYYASLSLPRGVLVDGYVLYNPGTGVVDPRADQGAVPLRFMSSPFQLP
jgi:hypothetical protein